MRILLLMDPYIPVPPENYGGIERIVYDVAVQYVKAGHQVTIVAGPNSVSPDRLITFGENGFAHANINFRHLFQVYSILSRELPQHDVIHNFGRLAYLSPFLKNPTPKVQSYLRWVRRFNIKKTDWLNPVNLTYTAVSRAIKETGQTRDSCWEVVYNCTSLDHFTFRGDTPADGYLAFIGRFERCKGLHNAIRVAKLTGRKLIIAGFISEIPVERKYYETQIKPYIDGVQIQWIGEINNHQRNQLLRNASALLTPVEWLEPFPVIIPEAYACGTPVLGFNRGGIPEGIDHGVTGFISSTVEEMAAQVADIGSLSRNACREKALREYRSEKIAADYFRLYHKPDPVVSKPLETKKILLIMDPGIPVPPPLYGGHERLVSSFAEEYRRLGHEVTLLAGPDSKFYNQVRTFGINDLHRSKLQKFRELLYVWRVLRAENFDLIHNFGRLAYLLPVLNTSTKKIMTYGRKIAPAGVLAVTKLPNRNLVFTACSNDCAKTGNIAGQWKTVYNAIDFAKYELNESVAADAPLMFLGRLDRIKGAHTAIRVARASGRRLLIAGNLSSEREGLKYFRSEIEPWLDGQQIIYLGALNDEQKNSYLRTAVALLFPVEWNEPFGMVMVEAMACGTPVIGFRRGGVAEVIDEGLTGIVVDSAEEMAAMIALAAGLDRRRCREHSRQRFDTAVIAEQYLKL